MLKPMNKNYWKKRYQNNETGWDAGTITTPIKEYIDQLQNKAVKILIPGCGNGHEFDYLIQKGFTNVFVIDIAEEPIEHLKSKNPTIADIFFITDDFFNLNEQFDLIFEQTFFCALSPLLRKKYIEKMNTLLHQNGKLVGLLFDFPLTDEGPPFGGSKSEYEKLFEAYFSIKILEKSLNSIKPRENKELFFIAVKK